jgi:hypothetical protein
MEISGIQLDACYQKSNRIVSRNIGGEAVLVPLRQKVEDLDCIFSLNSTGARVWELFDGKSSLRVVAGQVAAEYQVPVEQVGSDLLELVAQLLEIGALEQV